MTSLPTAETLSIEFKSEGRDGLADVKVLEAAVGMSNAEGGSIYIGIDDRGHAQGIQDPKSKWLRKESALSSVMDKTRPPVHPGYELIRLDNGASIARLDIPQSRFPVALSDGRTLKRRLNARGEPENQILFPYEFSAELPCEQIYDFSAKCLSEATLDDLSPSERDRLRELIRENGDRSLLKLSDPELDRALGFVSDEFGETKPTLCGLLMIGRKERLRQLMPTSGAVFQHLLGTEILADEEIDLPIAAAYERLHTFFRAYNRRKDDYANGLRTTLYDYPEAAFREAVMNAFCHRNYGLPGRIRVLMTENALTVTNPGGFIRGVTVDNLPVAEPRGRNVRLADAMKRVGLTERTGRGVDTIFYETMRTGLLWPNYEQSNDQFVRVEFLKSPKDFRFYRFLLEAENAFGSPLGLLGMMVLALLRNFGPRLSLSQLAPLLPKSFRLDRILAELEQLSKKGILDVHDTGTDPHYSIPLRNSGRNRLSDAPFRTPTPHPALERSSESAPVAPRENVLSAILEFLSDHGDASRSEIAGALGLSPQTAYRNLVRLLEDGRIEAIGKNRFRTYRLRQ